MQSRRHLFVEVDSNDLYNAEKTLNPYSVYYNRTTSGCKIVYYEFDGKWRKRLRQISFSPREIDPIKCVLTFRKIASSYNELLPYEEPSTPYTNGIYMYYKHKFEGEITALDMNSAYLWALCQPLADWETKVECTRKDVWDKKYDFYCFENDIHREMFYKEDINRMSGAMLWADIKIYGFKASRHYVETAKELYRLKCEVNKEKYKNVANIAVGCMHKRNGKQNNTTMAASLYAYFAWYIDDLVYKFTEKGYNVIMITTDSIKIEGKYNEQDNLIPIGTGLGEFKYEYQGQAKYFSEGHYEEGTVKWKGKPEYMRLGYTKCKFVEDIGKEKKIYERFAIK